MDKDTSVQEVSTKAVVTFQYFDSRCFCGGDKASRMAVAMEFLSIIKRQVPGDYPIKSNEDEVYIELDNWPKGVAFDESVNEMFKKYGVKFFD
jgi:peptidoglycan/xylan/chitin deacetylase (PgdA/CDA1 family)